jgi:phage tail sheath gpL-like
MISYNQVPTAVRVPFAYIEFSNENAVQGATIQVYKILVIGSKIASGTATADALVQVSSEAQAKTLFGQGSMLHLMFRALKLNNSLTETWAIPLADNGSGVAASGTITMSGSASAAGTLVLYIGGQRVEIAVTNGMTAAAQATAVAAAIEANEDLPVEAAVDGSITAQVNVTAKNKGVNGNKIDIRKSEVAGDSLPAGTSATIVAMASGATNPDVAAAITAMADEQFNVIAMPYVDATNLGKIKAELDDRAGPLRQKEGVAISAEEDSLSNLSTLGNTHNNPYLCIMGMKDDLSQPCEMAAAVVGVVGYYGNIDPARPFQTLEIKGIVPAKMADRPTLEERNVLLYDGISTFNVGADGTMRVERMITTYKTNAAGADDVSYLNLNTILTLSYLRYDFRNTFQRKYPRHKLANDGTRYGAGQAIITPKVAKGECVAMFRRWEEMGLVEGIDQFKRDLIVERNANDRDRLDILLPPDLVNQFRILGTKIAFIL